ncbi:hypothetical protein D3C72_1746860 [compost metagenome]
MIPATHEAERIGGQRGDSQPFPRHRIDQHAEVHRAGADLFEAIGLHVVAHEQADFRVLACAFRHIHRHQAGGDGGCTGDHHAAPVALAQLAGFFEGVVQLAEQPLQRRHQRRAGIGQHHLARGAIQQPHAKCFLKLSHAPAYRRLREADGIRRPAETAVRRHRQKDPQLPQCVIHATIR